LVYEWLTDELPPASDWHPLPPDVEALLRRCLAREPSERPNARELADSFRKLSLPRKEPVRGVLYGVLGGVTALALVSGVLWTLASARPEVPPPVSQSSAVEPVPQKPSPPEESDPAPAPAPAREEAKPEPVKRVRNPVRKATRRASPPQALERGTVRIRALPWGLVRVDGAPRGRAEPPFLDIDVESGERTIEITNPVTGALDVRTVRVEPGRQVTVRADLREPP
ncbi:MAG: hypothetical protein AAFY60_17280, partial [Myxococcota bacterium]